MQKHSTGQLRNRKFMAFYNLWKVSSQNRDKASFSHSFIPCEKQLQTLSWLIAFLPDLLLTEETCGWSLYIDDDGELLVIIIIPHKIQLIANPLDSNWKLINRFPTRLTSHGRNWRLVLIYRSVSCKPSKWLDRLQIMLMKQKATKSYCQKSKTSTLVNTFKESLEWPQRVQDDCEIADNQPSFTHHLCFNVRC